MKSLGEASSKKKRPRRGQLACDHEHVHPSLESALELLKASGFKLTRPRETLLKILMALPAPFSAEDVFVAATDSAERNGPPRRAHSRSSATSDRKFKKPSAVKSDLKIDLVTVYRSLTTFADLGILTRVELGDGVLRYEATGPEGHHHHHVVCTNCRKIVPLDFCSANGQIQTQEQLLTRMGYTALTHRLEFFGLCPTCNAAQSRLKA